ncbi:MAG: M20/M25/M40 family metallo-hydrolase [Bdellovibrionota bacterium]
MIAVDSLTKDVTGVAKVQQIVARELGALGFVSHYEKNPDERIGSADLLVSTLKGQTARTITFVSHADTVLDSENVGSYRKSTDGSTAIGSGAIDNKGGLAVAIAGLKNYVDALNEQNQRPHFTLKFVSSPNEEGGSTGFHPFFRSCAEDSVLVLGFEPALDNGSIIESRRGNRWYQLTVKGQEAHAGRCKGEQINAAHDLAIKIAKLHKLTDVKAGLAVNVGQIVAGRDRFNVVCGEAHAKIDARFASFEARDKLHGKIERILLTPRVFSTITDRASESSFTIEDDCPPFSATSASRALLKFYLKTIDKIEGRPVLAEKAGGAGDVNYMSRKGVIVLDGLGPIGGKMHTTEEFIYLPSLSTRAVALSAFLDRATRELRKKN